jgi:pentatricopeptide repeat protein
VRDLEESKIVLDSQLSNLILKLFLKLRDYDGFLYIYNEMLRIGIEPRVRIMRRYFRIFHQNDDDNLDRNKYGDILDRKDSSFVTLE